MRVPRWGEGLLLPYCCLYHFPSGANHGSKKAPQIFGFYFATQQKADLAVPDRRTTEGYAENPEINIYYIARPK